MESSVTTYGYARVSSADQCLNRQLDALQMFPVKHDHIFADKASGKDFERPAYQRLLRRLKPGDTVVIKSVDRLGRNYQEIINEWRRITVQKQVAIVVLDMPILDTRENAGAIPGITGVFMADLVLQIMSYVAQIERENIRTRQAEGISAAQARGVICGRPKMDKPEAFNHIAQQFERGELTRKEAAYALGVSVSTFYRWRREANTQIS